MCITAGTSSFIEVFLKNGAAATRALAQQGFAQLPTGVEISYKVFRLPRQTHGKPHGTSDATLRSQWSAGLGQSTCNKILLIMGFATTGTAWMPLVHNLLEASAETAHRTGGPTEICIFDNRGVGKSSTPSKMSSYTTSQMAEDTLCLMDHLGWHKTHVVGFSMGGMISCKLAAMQPHRVASLTLLSVTGGGSEIIPLSWGALRTALVGFMDRTDQGRAVVGAQFNFSPSLRQTMVNGRKLEHVLVEEYLEKWRVQGKQSADGEAGQLHACWKHSVTDKEAHTIRQAGFPVRLLHGHHDLIAKVTHAAKLGARLGGRLLLVPGGHFIVRESVQEVGHVIMSSMRGGSEDELATGNAEVMPLDDFRPPSRVCCIGDFSMPRSDGSNQSLVA